MFADRALSYPQKLYFLLVPGFSLFGLTSMLDPLRHANRCSDRELYHWQLISEKGGLISSSDSIEIMCNGSIKDIQKCGTLIVCAGYSPQEQITPALLGFIRQQANYGADIGSQDTAALITAAAGVLDGYRTTMHWENLPSTADIYPKVNWVQDLLVIDRKRFSCPGALSGLDMMLHLISTQHGNGLASAVADELVYTQKRAPTDSQRLSLQTRLNSRNPNLVNAIQLMERNIEEPLRIPELAEHLGISDRELERLFQHYLQATPNAYYRQIRLGQARWMLQQTTDSVTSISVACGFASLSHFTRSYQQQFHKKPSQER